MIAYGRALLDEIAPLVRGSHADATAYSIVDGRLQVKLKDGATALAQPERCAGWRGEPAAPAAVLLRNNGLHVEILIDRSHRIGQTQTVNAYRLISPGTVEEKIWELQQSKAQRIADVLGEEGFARSLSQSDLEYLFAED